MNKESSHEPWAPSARFWSGPTYTRNSAAWAACEAWRDTAPCGKRSAAAAGSWTRSGSWGECAPQAAGTAGRAPRGGKSLRISKEQTRLRGVCSGVTLRVSLHAVPYGNDAAYNSTAGTAVTDADQRKWRQNVDSTAASPSHELCPLHFCSPINTAQLA